MVGEASSVGILATLNKGHLSVVDQVVKKLREELGQPPHADDAATGRAIGHLPAASLVLAKNFLVVLSVNPSDSKGDLLVNSCVNSQIGVFAGVTDKESLVALDDGRFLAHI